MSSSTPSARFGGAVVGALVGTAAGILLVTAAGTFSITVSGLFAVLAITAPALVGAVVGTTVTPGTTRPNSR
ncbi:hypothetical protein ACWEQJ_29695 [Streptomyces cyaneofuscatus]|uniref:hypothetical protein n=1 Tax=Streptomyces cyaneofuscatus TaxID=66883 RepID=UPI0033A594DB